MCDLNYCFVLECIKMLESGDFNALQQISLVKLKQRFHITEKQSPVKTHEYGNEMNIRRKRIWLGHALLNLAPIKSNDIWVLLKNIVTSFDADLLPEEVAFIWYMFNYKNLPEDLLYLLFERYSFLYEKPILKLCVSLINSKSAQSILENAKNDQTLMSIWNAACQNQSFAIKIMNMLLNLYVLSNFNNNLLGVLNWYKIAR